MSNSTITHWTPKSPWSGFTKVGRYGSMRGDLGLKLALRDNLGLATVIVAEGQDLALRRRLSEHFQISLPDVGHANFRGDTGLVWSAPGQWLVVTDSRAAVRQLSELLRGVAAVTDQSDARAVVRISGPQARSALAKGVMLDLHPSVFKAGNTAVTNIAHIGAQLWQVSDEPVYDVAVGRTFAHSFWNWLTHAAVEFSYEVSQVH